MEFELTAEEGERLVRLARASIEAALGAGEKTALNDMPEKLMLPCGVFVTLNKVEGSSHSLRGCIGFPYPVKPLAEAVADAAVSAALRDPRFAPVSRERRVSYAQGCYHWHHHLGNDFRGCVSS